MNKFRIMALAAACSISLTAFTLTAKGDEAEYDAKKDPLVSLSYITEVVTPAYDKKIEALNEIVDGLANTANELKSALDEANAKLAESNLKLAEASDKIAALEAQLSAPEEEENLGQFEVVYMKKGAKLLADSPCEIILRSGSAIVVSITVNGLNNVTDGTELLNATEVPLFNQLLVPRGGDGRGIQITSEDSYVMVRGEYQIVE